MKHNLLADALSAALAMDSPRKETAPSLKIVDPQKVPTISRATDGVMVRMSFGKDFLIPEWARKELSKKSEKGQDSQTQPRVPGVRVLDTTPGVDMRNLRAGLALKGFVLTGAYFKARVHPRLAERKADCYHTLVFVFSRTPTTDHEWQEKLDNEIGPSLDALIARSLWDLRAYANPSMKDGVRIEGKNAISINLENPEMFVVKYGKDGKTITPCFAIENGNLTID